RKFNHFRFSKIKFIIRKFPRLSRTIANTLTVTCNPNKHLTKPNRLTFNSQNIINSSMQKFEHFIKTFIGIDEIDLKLILSKFREKNVPKGKFILKKGQIANQYFFIVSGGLRFFYDTIDKENTTWVVFKNEFFTEISSLHTQKPSRFNIQAIEETELLVIDKSDMDFLYSHIPVWQEFGRKVWEAMSVRMIDQILNFQTLSAEQRYIEFMSTPELLQKVSVKDLAAVLGITPNALSRIRKNIK
ncbi:Crp/Fnr family transcriptional regulator, partial [Halpernia frigidisoli]